MIIGRNFAEKLYSEIEPEDERLYSTGDPDLDDLLERAFCEGYEYAQKEFGRTGLNKDQAKQFFTKTGNRSKRKDTQLALGVLLGSNEEKAKTGKDFKSILKKATKEGKEIYGSNSRSGFTTSSDYLINARERLFKPLSKKKRQEFNKTMIKAVLKDPHMKNSTRGINVGRYSYDTGEYK